MDENYLTEPACDEEVPDLTEPDEPDEPEDQQPAPEPVHLTKPAPPPQNQITFDDADGEADDYYPPGTILEEEQPPCVKFEIDRAIEAGIDLQPFAGLTDMQLRQVRLAYEHGVGDQLAEYIKHGDDPNPYNHIQMEIIRLGLEQHLNVAVYAQERFNVNQMWQLFLAEQEGLPAKRIAVVDPKRYPKFTGDYTDEQMKELRLAMEEDVDLHNIDNPALTADEMHSMRRNVGNGKLRSPVRAAMDAYNRAKKRRKLEKMQRRAGRQSPEGEGGDT